MDEKLYDQLELLYYDPKFVGSLGGRERFFKAASVIFPTLTRAEVLEFLSTQDAYNEHMPPRRRFKRSRVFVRGIANLYQADLIDNKSLAAFNNNTRYLLAVIDVFSKYLWVIPIPNKTGVTIAEALKVLLSQIRVPEAFQTDKVII